MVDFILFYFSPGSELVCYAPKFSLGHFSVCSWADSGVAAIQHPPYVPQRPPRSEVHPAFLGPVTLSSKPRLTPFSSTEPSRFGAPRPEHFAVLLIRRAGVVGTERQTRGVHRAGGCDDVDSRPKAAGAIGDSFLALSPSPSGRRRLGRSPTAGPGRTRPPALPPDKGPRPRVASLSLHASRSHSGRCAFLRAKEMRKKADAN